MIIEAVLDVVFGLISLLLGFLPALPALPETITSVWSDVIMILGQGMAVLSNWLYMPVALPCLAIIVAAENFEHIYKLIAWFVNKIPFIGIKM